MENYDFTRRSLVAGLVAMAGLGASGCGQARKPDSGEARTSDPNPVRSAAAASAAMTVYRDPSCGCCEAWAEIARKAGYQVNLFDHPDMPAIKSQYGVPDKLLSCHTTIVGGYVVEGHVPLEHVQRLLEQKPGEIRGIAVAGMPVGSPGMEVPEGTNQPFQVMAFEKDGRVSVFHG